MSSVRRAVVRTFGAGRLALGQLRAAPGRTALAVLGVALAVLAVTLLVGVGAGVAETGATKLDQSGRDLWISGGPLEIAPGTVGGVRNPVVDSHDLAADVESHEDVATAVPLAVHVTYVGDDPQSLEPVLAVGTPGLGSAISVTEGEGFTGPSTHYANGTYEGPKTREMVVGPRIAERFDVGVNDTLHVGGTVSGAAEREYVVVGVSPTFSKFTGSPTVTLRLSELQTMAGSAGEDRASIVAVNLRDGADAQAVESELQRAHPEYEVRTNREQFVATLRNQAVIVAGGLSVVGVGLVAGALFALSMLRSLLASQRQSFSVLRAVGVSQGTLSAVALVQTAVVAVLGTALGLAATYPLATGLDALVADVTGFGGLVQVTRQTLLAGGVVALAFAFVGCFVAVWRLRTLVAPTELDAA